MVKHFEQTGSFAVRAGRRCKTWIPRVIEDIATSVDEQVNTNTAGTSYARAVSRQLELPYTTVWKCMRIAPEAYPYMIHRLQELKPADNGVCEAFELNLSDLRGQSYDNGANMRGKHKELQQKIIENNSRALYIPLNNRRSDEAYEHAIANASIVADNLGVDTDFTQSRNRFKKKLFQDKETVSR
ncbi:hypothetical protein HNY73_013599 [Argiope bruennichi]|uniref:Uncharacterized protein n=1 Tax=Argiope bruennichi TaxID=94029 RepID=A0A8T0F3E7_ARGBR|nr:hypothetical protein HNY73_013599 [Argiope bruennichi]